MSENREFRYPSKETIRRLYSTLEGFCETAPEDLYSKWIRHDGKGVLCIGDWLLEGASVHNPLLTQISLFPSRETIGPIGILTFTKFEEIGGELQQIATTYRIYNNKVLQNVIYLERKAESAHPDPDELIVELLLAVPQRKMLEQAEDEAGLSDMTEQEVHDLIDAIKRQGFN